MKDQFSRGLQGRTLKVYLYLVKENRSIGPRDIMRGLNLSSPSVSYRHLQKLENLGLISKNQKGNYILVKKTAIKGHLWIGKNLIPNSLFYFIIFLTIFAFELVVFTIHVPVETNEFKIFFFLLMTVTIVAMILFLTEGLRANKKIFIK
jgi:hypothetical protein